MTSIGNMFFFFRSLSLSLSSSAPCVICLIHPANLGCLALTKFPFDTHALPRIILTLWAELKMEKGESRIGQVAREKEREREKER